MGLSDIAEGLEVVAEQRERGVAAVDDTDRDLVERLAALEGDLPCNADAAASVVEVFTAGGTLASAAEAGAVAPVTAARTLHLLGVDGVSPLAPDEREPVRTWLAGECSRIEARESVDLDERTFALAAFVEAREPLPGAQEAIRGALSPGAAATVEKRDALAETMSDAEELR